MGSKQAVFLKAKPVNKCCATLDIASISFQAQIKAHLILVHERTCTRGMAGQLLLLFFQRGHSTQREIAGEGTHTCTSELASCC